MKNRQGIVGWLGGLALAAVALVTMVLVGDASAPSAAAVPKVVVLRCLPMSGPGYEYQLATLSKTADVEVDIIASTVPGEGDDCAVAIAEVIGAGIPANKMEVASSADAIVVTFVK